MTAQKNKTQTEGSNNNRLSISKLWKGGILHLKQNMAGVQYCS